MRQWKSFCISMHIRKGKAGHSIGITGDSLTKQQKCNMEPDFAQFTGSTATRRALAACQISKASWNASGRDGFAACAARSSCLHQLQARRTCSWQSCRSSWHWRRTIMTNGWLREQRHISPIPVSEQAGKALAREPCAAGPRASGPAQELFTEPLSRAKEEEKWFSFSKRAINHA